MKIKFYKYSYMLDGDVNRQGIEYCYSGSGFYLEDLKADVIGMLNNSPVEVEILNYEEISKEDYELITGRPFKVGFPNIGQRSYKH